MSLKNWSNSVSRPKAINDKLELQFFSRQFFKAVFGFFWHYSPLMCCLFWFFLGYLFYVHSFSLLLNWVLISFTDGTGDAFINSSFVSGNDIYLAEEALSSNGRTALYWKMESRQF